jgi:DNA-binding transcriptional ArsR family regulator
LNHVVEDQVAEDQLAEGQVAEDQVAEEQADAVFHALADPTRRRMLRQLATAERSIGELAAPLEMSFAGASKHVRALERAGLVHRTVRGRRHVCRLDAAPLAAADAWLRSFEQFWDGRLDALEALFDDEGGG